MIDARSTDKSLVTSAGQPSDSVTVTAADVRGIVESILRDRALESTRELIGFGELVKRLPLCERSIRDGIHAGWIPAIRLPGGRKLIFDWDRVCAALQRFEQSRG